MGSPARSNTILVAGTSNPELSSKIATELKMSLYPVQIMHFPDGECRVHVKEDVAGKQAIVIQSLGKKPNEYIVETMLIADALRRAGCGVTLVCPYLAYSRQNLPEQDGASLAARMFAHFLQEVGIQRLIAMDLHAEHIPSFYDFPVEHLSARHSLITAAKAVTGGFKDFVVVGPDLGSAKLVGRYAEEIQSSFALLQKRRVDARKVEILSLVGEVKGKNVLLADDLCSTASTMTEAATVCREKGANRIFACATHGLFVDKALERISNSPIERLFVSDTVAPDKAVLASSKICVVSVASVFASAIRDLIDRIR